MEGGITTSSTLSTQTLGRMQPSANNTPLPMSRGSAPSVPSYYAHGNLAEKTQELYAPLEPSARADIVIEENPTLQHFPLGAARAQIHENYIIAQSEEGLVIIDQHAAHERLVYERLKSQMDAGNVKSQGLLVPEIIDMEETRIHALLEHQEMLNKFGLFVEAFGADSLSVQAIPAIMGEKIDIKKLIHDIIDEIIENDTAEKLQKTLHEVLSSAACHGSVRSGRRMNVDEMNALMRQMEKTPNSGHCNHGRPTHITLNLKDIEKLFGRR
jgi:DNA mismatch repair protein MutL